MALDLRFCWKNKHMPRYGTCVRLGLKSICAVSCQI